MASVLIVDDEPLIRWSIAESLEAAGLAVVEAGSARDALAFFAQGRAPVGTVLLDLKLPDSSDLGLLRTIRQLAPECRVILMTAHGTPDVMEDARRAGAYAALSKPFDMDTVVTLVTEQSPRTTKATE